MPRLALLVRILVYCLIIAVIALAIEQYRPPRRATLEVGPVGGSFYEIGMLYKRLLAQKGIDLEVRPKDNSMEILGDVANPQTGVDIGFSVQDATPFADARLTTLGGVQMQPLFIFANADLGRRTVVTDLRGRRIVMPPLTSVTSDIAQRVFRLYDITPENTSFTFMPLSEAVKALRIGRFDAGVFMLAAENDMITELTHWSGLRLLSLNEAKAVVNHLPYLHQVVLPRGIYDIADGIPPADVTMVGGTVEVVVRPGLHPYLIYALLEAMAEVHRGSTLISGAGTYPTIAGTHLPLHWQAEEYHRDGVPWVYRNLPPALAAFVDQYLVAALVLFVMIELYRLTQVLVEAVAAFLARRASRPAG